MHDNILLVSSLRNLNAGILVALANECNNRAGTDTIDRVIPVGTGGVIRLLVVDKYRRESHGVVVLIDDFAANTYLKVTFVHDRSWTHATFL
mgnify:CR=1 FL=1